MSAILSSSSLVHPLPEGPLDIVGDVHGEWQALSALLAHLGYTPDARHPEGRHLVFVGDLCDRGPESPAVVEWLARHHAAGRVYAVLGNHELSILRGLRKDGNDWFYGDISDQGRAYGPMTLLPQSGQADVTRFFNQLPIVLERADLRIVHAAWDESGYQELKNTPGPVLKAFSEFEKRLHEHPLHAELRGQSELEKSPHRASLYDPDYPMPKLPAVSRWDTVRQHANPIRVMTSGGEQETPQPFFVGGAWRFVERAAWWDRYESSVPVIFGHYWRRFYKEGELPRGPYGRNLFYGLSPLAWLGPRGQGFCVDFSVGGRYLERLRGKTSFSGHLAALRWPERELVLDDGRRWRTGL